MAVIDDASAATLTGFVRDNVAAGATVHTDAWRGYRTLTRLGYDHRPRSQRAARADGEDIDAGRLPDPARPAVPAAAHYLPSDHRDRAGRSQTTLI